MFVVSPDLMRKARLLKQDIGISSEGAIYGGVLREVAFGSARIITKGVPQSCLDKQCNIRLDFDDPQESFVIGGTISKFEQVVNHPDTAILTLIYAELVPMSYKVRLCDYMLTLRQISQKPPQEAVASPAPPPKAPEAPEAEAAAVDDAPSA